MSQQLSTTAVRIVVYGKSSICLNLPRDREIFRPCRLNVINQLFRYLTFNNEHCVTLRNWALINLQDEMKNANDWCYDEKLCDSCRSCLRHTSYTLIFPLCFSLSQREEFNVILGNMENISIFALLGRKLQKKSSLLAKFQIKISELWV